MPDVENYRVLPLEDFVCDLKEQVKRIACVLAEYDYVPADWDENKLLQALLVRK
jgi:uncharacterized protein YutD